jgi:hypothetical protein
LYANLQFCRLFGLDKEALERRPALRSLVSGEVYDQLAHLHTISYQLGYYPAEGIELRLQEHRFIFRVTAMALKGSTDETAFVFELIDLRVSQLDLFKNPQ